MKYLKFIYTAFVAGAFLLSACETDLGNKVEYDPSQTVASILNGIGESNDLGEAMEAGDSIVFSFTLPEVNYSAQIINNIQADLKGENFSNPVIVSATIDEDRVAVAADELNNSLAGLLGTYGIEEIAGEIFEFEFRIYSILNSSGDFEYPIISNVISSEITLSGEVEYPKLWVIGDYCGWSHDNSQFLYSENNDGIYKGIIVFDGDAANGFKLTSQGDWNGTEYGAEAEAEAPTEPATLQLYTSGGTNIMDYGEYAYEFELNTTTNILRVLETYTCWGLIGDMTDAWAYDLEMDLLQDNDGHYLGITLDVEAGQEFKYRANGDWVGLEVSPNSVDSYEGCGATENGSNFVILNSGNCTIKWYFNKVKQKVVVTYN